MTGPPVSNSPKLMQFLTDEAQDPHYVDLLLERATAAAQPDKVVQSASGDAYNVTFGAQRIIIEHHYLKDWRVHIPREDFITTLRQWRTQLTRGS